VFVSSLPSAGDCAGSGSPNEHRGIIFLANEQGETKMPLVFSALPTEAVARIREGGPDAYGRMAERCRSDGSGNPCRHCLEDIPAGQTMLILAWRPFPDLQPYAETGPIFICAECDRRADSPDLPSVVADRPAFMIRGYSPEHRIAYGTGRIVETSRLQAVAEALLSERDVAYLHLRSAKNGCYQVRVDRAA
jgi:hypothetical protein